MHDVTDQNPGALGARVIFLHGYPDSAADLAGIAEGLNAECDIFEMPWMDADLSSLSVEAIVRSLIDACPNEPFHIVGRDIGAMIAWQLAHSAPARIKSLTLMSSPLLNIYMDNIDRLQAEGFLDYRMALETHATDQALPNLEAFSPIENTTHGVSEKLARNREATSSAALVSLYADMRFQPMLPFEAQTAPPILVIHGELDPFFPDYLFRHKAGSQPPNVTYTTIANAGHWPHLTHPLQCQSALKSFIEAHNG